MQRRARVRVPAMLSAEIEELVATLRSVKEESAAADPLDDDARAQLRSASDLLEQVTGQAGSGAPVEIAGPAALVRDALYGLLLDGADALAEACRAYEAGVISLERLCATGTSTEARVALFAHFEREDGCV
jgi:hypothetical protein